jgi:YD repeat-containing protein
LRSRPTAASTSPIDAAGRFDVAEAGAHRVRRQIPELQSFSADDVLIPSQDGAEIYQFNGNGRHERTLDALTAIAIETFAYDSAGRLSEIVDDEGKTTTIERDAAGAPVAILAPYGQRTQLTTGADGFLSAVSNAAGEPSGRRTTRVDCCAASATRSATPRRSSSTSSAASRATPIRRERQSRPRGPIPTRARWSRRSPRRRDARRSTGSAGRPTAPSGAAPSTPPGARDRSSADATAAPTSSAATARD